MKLSNKILETFFKAVIDDVNSGNSNFTKDELMEVIDHLTDGVDRLTDNLKTEYYDRMTLMHTYRISKREFYRLVNEGLLKEKRLPSSTKKVYSKTEMENLVAQNLVKTLK